MFLLMSYTHPLVCKSTLPCRSPDTRTLAYSRQSRGVVAKCPQSCTTALLRGSGLKTTKVHYKVYSIASNECANYSSPRMVGELTCDGAADFAPTGADAGAVPHHAVFRSLISNANAVRPVVKFVIAGLFSCRRHKQFNRHWTFLTLRTTSKVGKENAHQSAHMYSAH